MIEAELKTRYKYIHFLKIADKPKTSVWSCCNNKSEEELGQIKWYPGWRQYCYFPTTQAVYSVGCFEDVNDFMRQLR